MKKPVTLQINVRGAWRNVCDFDAADLGAGAQVMDGAATMAAHAAGEPVLRVVKVEGGYPVPLMRWALKDGWKDVRKADDDQ